MDLSKGNNQKVAASGKGKGCPPPPGSLQPAKRVQSALLLVVIGVVLLVSGCAHVGPDFSPPEPETQDVWRQTLVDGLAEGKADLQTWWTVFEDPVLDSLTERAAMGNLDLKEAFARIKEARARRGVSTGEKYPDFNGGGFAVRQRLSDDFLTPTPDQDHTYNSGRVGLDATWEIDFWGRISRSIESADAGLVGKYIAQSLEQQPK